MGDPISVPISVLRRDPAPRVVMARTLSHARPVVKPIWYLLRRDPAPPLGTARRQNQQPLPFLYKLLTTDTPTAQAALYANTA
jgi:hypothetical protein